MSLPKYPMQFPAAALFQYVGGEPAAKEKIKARDKPIEDETLTPDSVYSIFGISLNVREIDPRAVEEFCHWLDKVMVECQVKQQFKERYRTQARLTGAEAVKAFF